MDFQRLLADHDRIDRLCRTMMSTVTTEAPDLDLTLGTRTDLAGELFSHLARVEDDLCPAMTRRTGPTADLADAFAVGFDDLRGDLAAWADEWTMECIAQDWPTFRRETVAMVKRLRARMRREIDILYPAALRAGAVTLRPRKHVAA